MKQSLFTLEHTQQLTADVYEMVLSGDTSAITAPGQFVNLALPGSYLRRPISVCDWGEGALVLIVRAVGEGTRALVRTVPGMELDTLTGLGNGFDLTGCPEHPILIGGGVGAAPLFALAGRMRDLGIVPTVALGLRTAADAFYLKEFAALGCTLFLATEDGTLGVRGFVTDLVQAAPACDHAFVCGPTPMLKAVHALPQLVQGQYSFEARMACGFGVCMGCTIQTSLGGKRVCKDGPVFQKEEIVW